VSPRPRGDRRGEIRSTAARGSHALAIGTSFDEVLALIDAAKRRAYQAVNSELVGLYWQIGEHISRKLDRAEWGEGTVEGLAAAIAREHPGLRGFSRPNLFRMRQFYEAYRGDEEVSPLVRRLPWTHHLIILSRTKLPEERTFYILTAINQGWTKRELERQIQAQAFRRSMLEPARVSAALRQIHPTGAKEFKDAYALEFLGLFDGHSEADFHAALLRHLGRFITELGRDFCFVSSEYPVQVGNQDFALDLLFFHRGLSCLVAIELKVREFRPEDLGKLSFYLEALDRDVKKPHERPSIGVLLCATKDNEVVEYALSRTLSPALVAEYQIALPPKALLRQKLHELYVQLVPEESPARTTGKRERRRASKRRSGRRASSG